MRVRSVPAWLWTMLILVLCWLPRTYLPKDEKGPGIFEIPNLDKLIHLGIFAVFAFLWTLATSPPRRARRVFLAGLALAVISELGQEMPFVHRDASVADALADVIGVVVGIVAGETLARWFARRADPVQASGSIPSARS